MLNEARIKDVAEMKGYSKEQIEIAFDALKKANLSVIEKEDSMFDIKDNNVNDCIHRNVEVEMVIEIGFDALRTIIENAIREGNVEEETFNLLSALNSMFENRKYKVSKNENGQYLALDC